MFIHLNFLFFHGYGYGCCCCTVTFTHKLLWGVLWRIYHTHIKYNIPKYVTHLYVRRYMCGYVEGRRRTYTHTKPVEMRWIFTGLDLDYYCVPWVRMLLLLCKVVCVYDKYFFFFSFVRLLEWLSIFLLFFFSSYLCTFTPSSPIQFHSWFFFHLKLFHQK